MRRQSKLHKGFTLVELIAVITIMGFLAAVAGPKFIGNDAFEVSGVHNALLSSLRYAQKTAIAQRRTVYVQLNSPSRRICLGYTNNCRVPVIDPVTQQPYIKTFSDAVRLNATRPYIGFDGLGRPVPNTRVSYTIQNAIDVNQPNRVVQVEAETGYVR